MKEKKQIIYFIGLFLACLFIVESCAVEASPIGGPKDAIPPKIDSLKSTPNKQLFFTKQEIKLTFDEWIKLKNQNQIIVSPPLEFPLEVKQKGKSIIIDFNKDEKLYENTTYTINLGQSIIDFTEGNAVSNMTYVFSTGAFIDSLSISGYVIDDFTGEPKENVIISVYDNLKDSSIYAQRPLYFSKTNKEGRFQIDNMREDTFRIFAIDDKNLNYYKDQESEGMAFYNTPIYLDSAFREKIKLQFFNPLISLKIIDKNHKYGYLKMGFNRNAFDVKYNFKTEPEYMKTYLEKDTLHVWYTNKVENELWVNNGNKIDTIKLIAFYDSLNINSKINIVSANSGTRTTLGPTDTFEIKFNYPIEEFSKTSINLIDTSKKSVKYFIEKDKKDPRKLKIKTNWLEGQKYDIVFNKSSISSFLQNQIDSTNYSFIVSNSKSLGEIIFELDSLNENYNYLVILTQGQNEKIKIVEKKTREKLSFQSLSSGQYSVKIYEDKNDNKLWDPGNYDKKEQSELWISEKLESLKPGWTLEVKINGKEFGK